MLNGMDWTQIYLWLVVGAGVLIGALALVIGQLVLHRPVEKAEKAETTEGKPLGPDPFTHGSKAEKRRTFRRRGKCVEVDITDQQLEEIPWTGWVMDRSIKGLRLGVDRDTPVGTLLNVRVCNQTPPMPWYEVKVVHIKLNGQGYEIGCEFITPPTWNILLMFG